MTIREQILKHLLSLPKGERPTNKKIAETLNISKTSIERWRAGTHGLNEKNLDKLLDFLDLKIVSN